MANSVTEVRRCMPRGVKTAIITRSQHLDSWPESILGWLHGRGCIEPAQRGAQWRWTKLGANVRRDILRSYQLAGC